MPEDILEPQEDIFVEVDEPVDENPPAEEAPPEPEPPRGVSREDVYRFLADNPEEADHLKRLVAPQPVAQPAAAGNDDPRPDHREYSTYEEYFDALNAWNDREIDRRIAAQVSPLQNAVAPVVAAPIIQNATERISQRFGVPEEGKAYMAQMLQSVPTHQLQNMTEEDAKLLAYAAKGYAQDVQQQAPKPVGRVEPVAGIGPARYQLSENVSQGEWNAYLDLRRSLGKPTSGREFIAEMKKEGYLK